MYWGWVVDLGIRAKDQDLALGLDAFGEPLRPISEKTRKNRKSEMMPGGKGDPNAPPLTPGREKSRTRSLLAGIAFPDRAEFYWRFDPWTGASWSEILTYQAEDQGRDVFGLSPESTQWVRLQALARWRAWLRNPVVPAELAGKANIPPLTPRVGQAFDLSQFYGRGKMGLENVTLGINAPSRAAIEANRQRQGLMTESELKEFFRQAAPAAVQGRPSTAYNRLLQSVWGSPGQGRAAGGVEPLTPPPRRLAQRAAISPTEKPVQKRIPAKPPMPISVAQDTLFNAVSGLLDATGRGAIADLRLSSGLSRADFDRAFIASLANGSFKVSKASRSEIEAKPYLESGKLSYEGRDYHYFHQVP